jgi:hypothetical protein
MTWLWISSTIGWLSSWDIYPDLANWQSSFVVVFILQVKKKLQISLV